jgi:hypothetical protein
MSALIPSVPADYAGAYRRKEERVGLRLRVIFLVIDAEMPEPDLGLFEPKTIGTTSKEALPAGNAHNTYIQTNTQR